MEDVSNVFYSDAQQILKDIRKSNVNKLVFGQLNINSLRYKSDMLSKLIKGFVDAFMISETKLEESFPESQFFIDGYHTLFRYDRNGCFFTSARTYQQMSSTVIFQLLKFFCWN